MQLRAAAYRSAPLTDPGWSGVHRGVIGDTLHPISFHLPMKARNRYDAPMRWGVQRQLHLVVAALVLTAGGLAVGGLGGLPPFDAGPASASAQTSQIPTTTWGAQLASGIPNLHNPDADLVSISCPQAGACVAVGRYYNSESEAVDAVFTQQNGRWTLASLPITVPNGTTYLRQVSCSRTGFCAIVGGFLNPSDVAEGILITGWGSSWQWEYAPLPSGAAPVGHSLSTAVNVSCASDDDCAATGTYANGTSTLPMIERWNGALWSPMPVPLPNGAIPSSTQISEITCPTPGSCIAAGTVRSSNNSAPLGFALTGGTGTWETTPLPLPSEAIASQGVTIKSLSCVSAENCTIGANFTNTSETQGGVVYSDSGGPWSDTVLGGPPATGPLVGLSCSSSGCAGMALGSPNGVPSNESTAPPDLVVFTGSGSNWTSTPVALPGAAPGDSNEGAPLQYGATPLSCGSTCEGIFTYDLAAGGQQLAVLAPSVAGWSISPIAASSDGRSQPYFTSEVNAVSCAGDACAAAGQFESATGAEDPMLATGSQGTWNAFAAPLPAATGKESSQLSDLSCASPDACVATGSLTDTQVAPAIAISKQGDIWGESILPVPSDVNTAFAWDSTEVTSCGSTSTCLVAGNYTNQYGGESGFLDTGFGVSWSSTEAPLPSGIAPGNPNQYLQYGAADCPTSNQCVVVGSFEAEADVLTQHDGTWATTVPAVPGSSGLSAVSCPQPIWCMAVGTANEGASAIGVSGSGSSWTPSTVPLPSGASRVQVTSVSCVAVGKCVAEGTYFDASERQVAVILTFASGTWTVIAIELPADAATSQSDLTAGGVSCAGSTCLVDGTYDTAGESWQGFALSINAGVPESTIEVFGPGGQPVDDLGQPSCATASVCATVGSTVGQNGAFDPVVLDDVGGLWSAVAPPAPSGVIPRLTPPVEGDLQWIDCPSTVSPLDCVSAGYALTGAVQGLLASDQPVVSSLSTSTGPPAGGSLITITGDDFTTDSAVDFGTLPADSVTYVSPTQLEAVSPPGTPGPIDVTVTSGAGTSSTGPADRYTYLNPTASPPSYLEVASDGGVFAFGAARYQGSMGDRPLAAPIVGLASTPGGGYWEIAADGGVFAFGNAGFFGSMGGRSLVAPIVGLAPTPDGGGYWEIAADGGAFSFGDAGFFGSMGGKSLVAPIVGLAPTPDGGGYWEVAADGGVFGFGDAGFFGSMGGKSLAAPIVGLTPTRDGGGYWLVAADGGVFSFGDAGFAGSMGGKPLVAPIVGLTMPRP